MSRSTKRVLSEIEQAEFIEMYVTNVPARDIRAHFKMGEQAFRRYTSELQLARPARSPRVVPDNSMIGTKFASLTITGFEYDTKYQIWKATLLCDCGNTGKAKLLQLHKGERKTCGVKGCPYFHEVRKTHARNGNITGCEDIYGSRWGGWRCGASARNLEFSVTPEFGWSLFLKQDRKCALSGVDISFGNAWNKICTASLDRIDSNIGYTETNVQWVHKNINLMKRAMSDAEFLDWCKRVVLYSGSQTNS